MKLSVVTTMYQSAPYVDEFYRRARKEVEKIVSDFEIILVNDGSTDLSLDVALDLQKEDGRIRLIDLSRNFGHHKAIMTGLEYARGDLVFLIDVDLEEPPEIFGTFYEALTK
jgi:putative glycosyltransferase